MATSRSSHSIESSRMLQAIGSLQEEADTSKNKLANSKNLSEQLRCKLTEQMVALEREQRLRAEAEDVIKMVTQELEDRNRQLDHMRQQLIVAEDELEQTTKVAKHLRHGLDTYQQKFDICVNMISTLEADLDKHKETQHWSRKQVNFYSSILYAYVRYKFLFISRQMSEPCTVILGGERDNYVHL